MATPSPTRVAYTHLVRQAASPKLDAMWDNLRTLEELSSNLSNMEEAFSQHFKLASKMDPEVRHQLDVLRKAKEGLRLAQSTLENINEILEVYPEDKAAQRAARDAAVMVRRFQRHADAAQKIVRTVSKKQMPPALKKLAAKVTRGIKKHLVDPSVLQVIPWQKMDSRFVNYGKGAVEGVEYQVVYRIENPFFPRGEVEMTLAEPTYVKERPYLLIHSFRRIHDVTAEDAISHFLSLLKGWEGLKGEEEANLERSRVSEALKKALIPAVRRLGYKPHFIYSPDDRRIEVAYRSNLPKDGAFLVGEQAYEEMVDNEIRQWRSLLDPILKPYKSKIERVDVFAGEKSWITTTIILK